MFDYANRSIPELIDDWHPNFDDKWRSWISEAFALYLSPNDEERLHGHKKFAIALGDKGAPEACVLVALAGLEFAESDDDRVRLEVQIRTVTVRIGFEIYHEPPKLHCGVPAIEYADKTKWLIDRPAYESWRDRLLLDFQGSRRKAADCCIYLAAIHAGVLRGGHPLTIENLLNKSLWKLTN